MRQGVLYGIRFRWYAITDDDAIPGEQGLNDVQCTSMEGVSDETCAFASIVLSNLLDRIEKGEGRLSKVTMSIAIHPHEEAPLYLTEEEAWER